MPPSKPQRKPSRHYIEHFGPLQSEEAIIGYFGSYARGDWGPGSDLDMIMIVHGSEEPFERRAARWDATALPVPVELLVYTQAEWEGMALRSRFYQTVMGEAIWVYVR